MKNKIPTYQIPLYPGFLVFQCCDVSKFFGKDCEHTYLDLETSEKLIIVFPSGKAIYDIIAHPNWLKKLRDKNGNKIGPVDIE